MSLIYIDYRGPLSGAAVNRAYKTTRYGGFYKSAEAKSFQEVLSFKAKQAMKGKKRLEGPVSVLIDFWFVSGSDIDSCLKMTLDSLNGIVWEDDKQVVELSVGKHKALRKQDVGVALTVNPVVVEARERKP